MVDWLHRKGMVRTWWGCCLAIMKRYNKCSFTSCIQLKKKAVRCPSRFATCNTLSVIFVRLKKFWMNQRKWMQKWQDGQIYKVPLRGIHLLCSAGRSLMAVLCPCVPKLWKKKQIKVPNRMLDQPTSLLNLHYWGFEGVCWLLLTTPLSA